MKLKRVRVQNYRSIVDTGVFEVEKLKTILVGPNEAGKTVLLRAIQQLNKPEDIEGFNAIRDYPRSLYSEITEGNKEIENIEVVRGYFELEDSDKELIPEEFKDCTYVLYRKLNNGGVHTLENAPKKSYFIDIKNEIIRLSSHLDKQYKIENPEVEDSSNLPSIKISSITSKFHDYTTFNDSNSKELIQSLESNFALIDEDNSKEEARYNKIISKINFYKKYDEVLSILDERTPVFVLFNNYFKVKPSIHLEHLAERVEQKLLEDDKFYDYGNLCLLKLLGFSPRELSNIGKTESPAKNDVEALQVYTDTLDDRTYRLNAASIKLTKEIKSIWNPDPNRPEAEKIRISADGQYLKVVVEDEIGVEIELDQRSEGFQWMVSFFVVFFAESMDTHKNAILLLDEPGLSLHGLKQRDFRETISRLSEKNQTIYTTHSPFLVGANELDLVRVVELKDREVGTKVHTTLSSSDPAGLLPLQEALGYDLAQSLFTQQRNLILEGLTDYWYIEATSNLLSDSGIVTIDPKIALVFANSAGKVVYYATILHAHKLKIAALLDSDNAGDQAAEQENLVHALGNKKILRTKDFYSSVPKAEIEDLLRETLIEIVKTEYSKDVSKLANENPQRPIIDILKTEIPRFSKYKLAKAYLRWCKEKSAKDLKKSEVDSWTNLISTINKILK